MAGKDLLLEQAPKLCSKCGKAICLRKQVINLVLGNEEEMFCLVCLGADSGQEARQVLLTAKEYIKSRDCFKKEWIKYEDKSYCPDPKGCFLTDCFAE
jgi:hypothetical protein